MTVTAVGGHLLGVGTDLVDVGRLRAALDRRAGLRTRLFTEQEWDFAASHHDPLPHLAARFAAKESVMKALGRGMDSMGFAEIEVLRSPTGVPSVGLSGRAEQVAAERGVGGWLLSLTHTAELAQAVAIAVAAGPSADESSVHATPVP